MVSKNCNNRGGRSVEHMCGKLESSHDMLLVEEKEIHIFPCLCRRFSY